MSSKHLLFAQSCERNFGGFLIYKGVPKIVHNNRTLTVKKLRHSIIISPNILQKIVFLHLFWTILGLFGLNTNNQNFINIMNINDYYESAEQRKARRNRDIKTMFQHLVIDEGMHCMDAYEIVGYHFYLSACEIRRIMAAVNKSVQNAH